MTTAVVREKPVVIVADDDGDYSLRLTDAFAERGNVVKPTLDLDEITELIHEKTAKRICLIVSGTYLGAMAILSYIKLTASNRVLTLVTVRLDPSDSKRRTILWTSNLGVRYVFNKRVDLMEEIVATVNYTPVWDDFDAVHTDDLTGLENRQGFLESVVPELELMRDRRHRLGKKGDRRKAHMDHAAVLVIDANRLKVINDVLGHLKGDEAIVAIADALKKRIRAAYHTCRKSGDEFLVWLPGQDLEQAERRGHILTSAIAEVDFKGRDGERWPLSAFFGAASIHANEIGDAETTLKELIDKADLELLEIKKKRNEAEGKKPGER